MRDTTTRHGLVGESFVGDYQSPVYGGGRVVSADQRGTPAQSSALPRRIPSLESTQIRTPGPPTTSNPMTSPYDDSCLSTPQQDTSWLVPNRRRSYSEVSYPFGSPTEYRISIPPSYPKVNSQLTRILTEWICTATRVRVFVQRFPAIHTGKLRYHEFLP